MKTLGMRGRAGEVGARFSDAEMTVTGPALPALRFLASAPDGFGGTRVVAEVGETSQHVTVIVPPGQEPERYLRKPAIRARFHVAEDGRLSEHRVSCRLWWLKACDCDGVAV